MERTGIRHPCPRCGGKLKFRHTVESHRTGAPVEFFRCKTAATFIQLNAGLLKVRFHLTRWPRPKR